MKKLFKIMGYIILTYLAGGLLIHYLLLPEKEPDYAAYFKTHQNFESKMEGMRLSVKDVVGNKCNFSVTIMPHATGPIPHSHENFEEKFFVKNGLLSIEANGVVKRLRRGESITINPNTIHRPFNETDSVVILEHNTMQMPCSFAYSLSRLYGFWDRSDANRKPPALLLKLAVFGSMFDSWPAREAPPKPVLKALKFLLAPTARLMGYSIHL